jgi:hypothetical protein
MIALPLLKRGYVLTDFVRCWKRRVARAMNRTPEAGHVITLARLALGSLLAIRSGYMPLDLGVSRFADRCSRYQAIDSLGEKQ